MKDYPPDDEEGFLAFAHSLPQPDLYEAIKDAEPLTPIAIHKFPANRRRHYERLSRFPEGFVALGVNLLNSYARRVHELSTFDPQVTLLLYQVLQAIKPPTALFSPSMLAKVFFKRQPRSKQQEGQIVVNNANTLEHILK